MGFQIRTTENSIRGTKESTSTEWRDVWMSGRISYGTS
jgi:hypothetical protein